MSRESECCHMGGEEGDTNPKIEEMFGDIHQLQQDSVKPNVAQVRESNEGTERPNEPTDEIAQEVVRMMRIMGGQILVTTILILLEGSIKQEYLFPQL